MGSRVWLDAEAYTTLLPPVGRLVRKWMVSEQAAASRRSVAEPGWVVAVRCSPWAGQAAGSGVTL